MSDLLFKRGSYASLKTLETNGAIQNGTIYFTADEGGMYIGAGDRNKAVRIQGSVLYFETAQDFLKKVEPPYSSDVLYFIAKSVNSETGEDELWNALMRWDGSKFVQINTTAADVARLETDIKDNRNDIATIVQLLGTIEEGNIADKLADLAEADILINEAIGGLDNKITLLETNSATKEEVNNLSATVGEHQKSIEDLAIDLETKASNESVTILSGSFETHVSNFNQFVEGTFEELKDKVDEHATKIEEAEANIEQITIDLGLVEQTANAAATKTQVDELETLVNKNKDDIATKASQDEVDEIGAKAEQNKKDIENIVANYATKEELEEVNELNAEQGRLITSNADAIEELQQLVSGGEGNVFDKIDGIENDLGDAKKDIENLTLRVGTVETAVNETLPGLIDSKADQSDVTAIRDSIGTVPDGTTIMGTVQELLLDVEGLQKNDEDFTVSINGLKTAVETTIPTQIENLQKADENINKDINNLTNNKADKTALQETDDLAKQNKQDIETIVKDYATKLELAGLEEELDNHILAANAMRFKGTVDGIIKSDGSRDPLSAENPLPVVTDNIGIGDTYVASTAFKIGNTQVHAGDLIIANGIEDEEGHITAETLAWQVVDTGYIESHENLLDSETIAASENEGHNGGATLRLSSYTNRTSDQGNLGKIAIVGSDNVTIEHSYDNSTNTYTLNIGMKWDTF